MNYSNGGMVWKKEEKVIGEGEENFWSTC